MTSAVDQLILPAIPRYRWTADQAVEGLSLAGKNVIITGGTSGIGIPTVIALARTGANVTFTARESSKGAQMVSEVRAKTGNSAVHCMALDLASYKSVKAFAESWGDAPVHILLHNAGVMACPLTLTEDGEEQQAQVNFFSAVLLTELLRPRLAEHARVVIVSSIAHKRLVGESNVTELYRQYLTQTPSEPPYNKWVAYAVSKSAAIMYSNALNAEFEASGHSARVNSLHPGGIMTGLQTHLSTEEKVALGWIDKDGNAMPAFKNAEEGAATSVWAATTNELSGKGGLYLENCAITSKDAVAPPANDAAAPLLARLRGTAPHVWDQTQCVQLTSAARQRLREKGFLP